MNKDEITNKTADFVKEIMSEESSGHDWWHIYRVWNLARKIAEKENANIFIVEMAALLHDVEDWKLKESLQTDGKVKEWFVKVNISEKEINEILHIIENISYKGANVAENPLTIEGKIVQDADRIDAIGAIGVARAFAYGGSKGRELYNPEIEPEMHNDFAAYKSSKGHTINHFYEKLLLLKDRMNTETAKQIAIKRHEFLITFLENFNKEWNLEDVN